MRPHLQLKRTTRGDLLVGGLDQRTTEGHALQQIAGQTLVEAAEQHLLHRADQMAQTLRYGNYSGGGENPKN